MTVSHRMGNLSERILIRTANPADSEAVTALLAASLALPMKVSCLVEACRISPRPIQPYFPAALTTWRREKPAILWVAEAGPQRSQEPETSLKGKRTFVILERIQIGPGKELAAPFLLIASVMPGHSGYGN